MNLDPVDIFGETLAQPFKRLRLFAAALFVGGWTGEISMNVGHGDWVVFGWSEFRDGFVWPLEILFSSAGPLLIVGLLMFVFTSWRLDWMWFAAAGACSAFVMNDGEAGTGWLAWAALNIGLAGVVWLNATWQKTRWARDLAELSAHNAIQRAMRESGNNDRDETDESAAPTN